MKPETETRTTVERTTARLLAPNAQGKRRTLYRAVRPVGGDSVALALKIRGGA